MTSSYVLRFETGDRRGEEVPLGPGKTRLGRRKINEVRVIDPSVSSEHAEINLTPGGIIELSDCGSTNGVRVQGVRIERCQLDPGAVFALGNVKLRLVEVDGAGLDAGPGAAPAGPAEEGLSLEEPDADDSGAGGLVLEEFGDAPKAPSIPARSAPPKPAAEAPTARASFSAPLAGRSSADLPEELSHTAVIGAEPVGEGVGRISADAVDRAGRKSALGWIVGVVILGGAGYAGWMQFSAPGAETPVADEVAPVQGNLLAGGYSFEGGEEGTGWEEEGDTAVFFVPEPGVARSGRFALEAVFGGGEWGVCHSEVARVRPHKALTLTAHVRVEEDAGARVGLRLSSSSGQAAPLVAWSAPVRANDAYEPVVLAIDVPAAFDRAEALLGAGVAEGEDRLGIVQVDDVALLQESGPLGTAATFEEYELGLYGQAACLSRIDRVLLSRIRVARSDSSRLGFFSGTADAGDRGGLVIEPAENGARLTVAGTGAELALSVELELAGGGIATTGPSGYRAHTLEFDDQADAVLLGSGLDLVRLGFAGERRTVGRPGDSAYELRIALEPGDAIDVQLSFLEARDEARHLASQARDAEARSEPGRALTLWSSLLDEYPFEAALVSEAGSSVAQLFQEGADEVRGVRGELERARFFGLTDLYRQTRDRARAIEERYTDTEVAELARTLVTEVDLEIAADEAAAREDERARLEAIANVLNEEGSEQLAEHVRQSVAEKL